MNVEDLIKRIQNERESLEKDIYDADGMQRLQDHLLNYNGEYRLVWSSEIQKELENKPRKPKHTLGIELIDGILGGFREQQMIGLAAHSGHGKTAMGLFMLEKYKHLNPVLIPLEQSTEELIEQRQDNGQFVPEFLSPYRHSARVRTDWIEHRIVEGIAKYNSRIIVIDHLGYVDGDPKHDRDPEPLRIERKLQEIKNFAKKWNVVIIVLIHITQLDEGVPPSLVNLKGSSAIRQECDTIILLWRKNSLKKKVRVYKNETLFSVQKNRSTGKNGNVGLLFDPSTGQYTEENSWVKAMEEVAQQENDADESFENF